MRRAQFLLGLCALAFEIGSIPHDELGNDIEGNPITVSQFRGTSTNCCGRPPDPLASSRVVSRRGALAQQDAQ